MLSGRHLGARLPQLVRRSGEPGFAADLLFGIGYGTVSLSCTLPIFLAATGTAVTGSAAARILSLAAYAAGMGTILTALSLAAALSRRGLAVTLRRLLPHLDRIGGVFLIASGTYLVYYWAFSLLPGSDTRTGGRSIIERGELISSRLATWLSSDTGKTVATALLVAISTLVVWTLWRWLFIPKPHPPGPEPVDRPSARRPSREASRE